MQNTRDVGYNAKLKLTTAKYYIPSGRCIQAVEYKNGEPVEIADSLKVAFKTHNGRTIYDGGGIIPDIKLPHEKPSPFERALLEKHTIFDYATDYHNKHTTIADAKTFRLTDADYTDFVGYAKQKGFAYDTDTEKLLKQVEDKAKAEKMTDLIRTELAALRNKISTEKQADFTRFKKEINATLEREIVGRYYAQKGKIQHTLAIDDEVREASAVLRDDTRYNTLLKNTKK